MSKIKKQLKQELEKIASPKVTIDDSAEQKQFNRKNKPDVAALFMKLYDLCQRAIGHIPTETAETSPTTGMDNCSTIMKMVKDELARTLPDLVKEGLASTEPTPDKNVETSTCPVVNHTLVIEKIATSDDETTSEITENEWVTVVKNDVKKTLNKVPVIKAGTSSHGTARLRFGSKEDLDQAQEALKSKYKVTSKSEEQKMLNPKLTLAGLDPDITSKEELETALLDKNDIIKKLKDDGEEFKVVFLDKNDRFAVLQVSPAIRAALKTKEDKVCLGLEMLHVKNRYHVIQCYHCQDYGHTSGSPYCRSKDTDPTCFYCAGNHTSKECTKRKEKKTGDIKCSNCLNSRTRTEKAKAGTHKASDTLCPFYIREKLRVMSRTHASEGPKNAYQIRVRELQKKLGRV